MLSYDEMPEDNADLARVQVSFPCLPDNTAETCPVPLDDIMDYLCTEVPDGEQLNPEGLQFLRTAQVVEEKYWIWRFTDPSGADCYAQVSIGPDGTTCVGYDENYFDLTPEQYLLGVYHQVF